MFPPKLVASEKVTKSPVSAPWPVAATVITEEPSVAVNTSFASDVALMGVMSLKFSPTSKKTLLFVPSAKKSSEKEVI